MARRVGGWGIRAFLVPGAVLVALVTSSVGRAEEVALTGLSAKVTVHQDTHGIPHIYAESWTDAARTLGYLHATDRLWQMDMLRRQASGLTAEVRGPEGLASDILMRQLGIRRTSEQILASGELPTELVAEMEAYAAGVNARLAELGEDHLPQAFRLLGYKPAPWTAVDCLVFPKYMAWDQSGTMDDLWFGTIVEKLGVATAEMLWPLDRPYELPTVGEQADRARIAQSVLRPLPGMAEVYADVYRRVRHGAWLGRGGSFGSNNWAIDGTKTASGKPMLCNDPHLGFMLPSIWYAAHLSVQGRNVVGVTFPGAPLVIIGHNDRLGWGITNMQADAVDFFVEQVPEENQVEYYHRGELRRMSRVIEEIPVRGAEPHKLEIETTVHGVVISRKPRTISLQWTGLAPTTDAAALWGMSRATNATEFLAALDRLVTPPLNIVYADVEGNIGLHPCGALPIRTRGQGRIPLDGAKGEDDWGGYIPRNELPLAFNPVGHYVASANGRPHPVGYPHYLGWMWDPSYRTRRIHRLLSEADKLTQEQMMEIQLDHHDLCAERFLPVFLGVEGLAESGDRFAAKLLVELKKWNFRAGLDSVGPLVWLRWFENYRAAVWDDEWKRYGIEKTSGSWGFTGDNGREPMLEVLEFLTHHQPESLWFDDHGTDERETRDELIRRSFRRTLDALRKQLGETPQKWLWKHHNVLRVGSLTGVEELNRGGMPVVGDSFTLNPGGDGGSVGGGACWRMIVDFAEPGRSIGVYPGGQSEDPTSPRYDDLVPLWATGQYVPLHMLGDPADLPAEAKTATLTLAP